MNSNTYLVKLQQNSVFISLRATLLLEQFERICMDQTQNQKHFCSILSRRYGCSWCKM